MLKISVETAHGQLRLRLEGKLSGVWVDELERIWLQLPRQMKHKSPVVDLSGVTYLDEEGKKLLAWMYHEGAELEACDLLMSYVVDQIKRRLHRRAH